MGGAGGGRKLNVFRRGAQLRLGAPVPAMRGHPLQDLEDLLSELPELRFGQRLVRHLIDGDDHTPVLRGLNGRPWWWFLRVPTARLTVIHETAQISRKQRSARISTFVRRTGYRLIRNRECGKLGRV